MQRQFRFMWRAWNELADDRPALGGGFGPIVFGNIPWTVVRAWCADNRISECWSDVLMRVLRAMNSTYLAVIRKKQDRAKEAEAEQQAAEAAKKERVLGEDNRVAG